MDKKTTQKEYYTELIKILNKEESSIPISEFVEFLQGRIDLLDKKSSNKKPTKVQEANEEMKDLILQIMTDFDKPVTSSEILADARIEKGTSGQKITSMLTQLKNAKKVIRTENKGKAYFAIA